MRTALVIQWQHRDITMKKYLSFIAGLLSLTACSTVNAEYVLKKNSALALCNEFLEMLNSKPVNYYTQRREPHPDFKQFVPVKLTLLPNDNVYYQDTLNYLNQELERESDSKKKEKLKKAIENNKKFILKASVKSFISAPVDANHDGKKEQFYVVSHGLQDQSYGELVRYQRVQGNKIDRSENKASFTGFPFLYKGRFYYFSAAKLAKTIQIVEPTLPYKKEAGFSALYTVCSFKAN